MKTEKEFKCSKWGLGWGDNLLCCGWEHTCEQPLCGGSFGSKITLLKVFSGNDPADKHRSGYMDSIEILIDQAKIWNDFKTKN